MFDGTGIGYEKPENKTGKVTNLSIEDISKKMDSLKKWTTSAALLTKQYLGEKFGHRTAITMDPELEAQINFLYSSHDRYKNLLRQFSDLFNSFTVIASGQFSIAQCIESLIDAEGGEDFEMKNSFSNCKNVLTTSAQNTELICKIINYIVDELQTLCHQTMNDSVQTAKEHKISRLTYDSVITDYENMRHKIVPGSPQSIQIEENIRQHQDKYKKVRDQLSTKLRFLEANKVNVMKHHLDIFSKALTAYYKGNGTILNEIIRDLSPPYSFN